MRTGRDFASARIWNYWGDAEWYNASAGEIWADAFAYYAQGASGMKPTTNGWARNARSSPDAYAAVQAALKTAFGQK
jgi:hypothetical protein